MENLVAPSLSKLKIQKIANLARRVVLKEEELCQLMFPVVMVIERLVTLDTDFNYIIVEDSELPGIYANYCPTTNTMTIRQSVYTGAIKGNGRDRFTLAHELGHYFLHDNEASFSRQENIDVLPFQNPEWHANTFASVILMPRQLIAGLTTEEISDRCGTSAQAAAIAYDDALRYR